MASSAPLSSALPSYTSSTADKPLLGMTIGDKFDQIAAQYPDNDALIALHQNIHWSYRELQQEVNRCARALLAIGVRKGDRVGIWAPNCSVACRSSTSVWLTLSASEMKSAQRHMPLCMSALRLITHSSSGSF